MIWSIKKTSYLVNYLIITCFRTYVVRPMEIIGYHSTSKFLNFWSALARFPPSLNISALYYLAITPQHVLFVHLFSCSRDTDTMKYQRTMFSIHCNVVESNLHLYILYYRKRSMFSYGHLYSIYFWWIFSIELDLDIYTESACAIWLFLLYMFGILLTSQALELLTTKYSV